MTANVCFLLASAIDLNFIDMLLTVFYAMLQTYGATRVLLDLATRNTPGPRSNVSPRVKEVKSLNKPRDKKYVTK